MWRGILAFLSAFFRAFTAWQDGRQRDADRQAGRDEVKGDVLEKVETAKRIDGAELPDSLLKHPDKR